MNTLSEVLCRTYDRIAEADEGPQFSFRPNVDCRDTEAYCRLMHDSRKRDQMIGATQRGPHRDDFNFSLQIGSAREYASDGQQRGLCVALRIAQASFYRQQLGLVPVLLADDVLGELDPIRRQGFWRACPEDLQVVATGTELPAEPEMWSICEVLNGQIG